jgi:ubiquinone biosynthesis protein
VLVAEWVDGLAPGDPSVPALVGKKLAAAAGDAVFHQILVSGFFHADPHPGNLRVTADGRLAFLDWGLAGQLTRRMRRFLAELFAAVDAQDAERIVRVVLADPSALMVRVDAARLEAEVAGLLRRHRDFSTETGGVGRLMLDLLKVLGASGLRLACDYTLLARAVLTLENSCLALDPDFEIAGHARDFVKRLTRQRLNPVRWSRELVRDISAGGIALADAPVLISRLLRRIESGAAGIVVEHKGIEDFSETIDRGVNRLVFAIIVAALLVGSSLLVRSGADSRSALLGIIGYVIAVGFTVYLLFDIIRHGRHK